MPLVGGALAEPDWAVVLGASAGSGASIARALAADPGLHLFGAHRGNHPESAQSVTDDVCALDRKAVFHVGDVGAPDGIEPAIDTLKEALQGQKVKVFVHALASASLGRFTGVDKPLSPRQVHKTFDVMAHSFLFWVQALHAADLLAPNARILALTNPLDESLIRDCGLIASTKAALHGYVRALALELGPEGHRVNLLKFSTVITPAVRKVYGEEAIGDITKVHERLIPAGRLCTTDEVAKVVSFLAGPHADYFNGATVDFSGSMTLGMADLLLGSGS